MDRHGITVKPSPAITNISGGTTLNLNSQEQIALKEFTGFLANRLADNYLYSCLFGSKARGDAQEGSDLKWR
jgi:hypothetical protein